MSFFKDIFGGIGEAAGTVGALALGAAEAVINKIDGKDNDEILRQWERTIEAGADLGSSAGSGLGELVQKHGGEIVKGVVTGVIVHEVTKERKKKGNTKRLS